MRTFRSLNGFSFGGFLTRVGAVVVAPALSWVLSAIEITQFAVAPTSPAPQPLTAADFY